MAVRKVSYCYVTIPNRPGHGAKVLGDLRKAKVNLLACSAFPIPGGNSQLDLVAGNLAPIRKVATKNGWKLSNVKKGFLIQGKDRVGAVHRQVQKLADEGINVTAADAVCAGKGRFGMLLWVRDADYAKASRALKAK